MLAAIDDRGCSAHELKDSQLRFSSLKKERSKACEPQPGSGVQTLDRVLRENVAVQVISASDFPLQIGQFIEVLNHLGLVN